MDAVQLRNGAGNADGGVDPVPGEHTQLGGQGQ